MSFFSTDYDSHFDLTSIEALANRSRKAKALEADFGAQRVGAAAYTRDEEENGDQFILFQLDGNGASFPSKVPPELKGDGENKDVNMVVDFDSFHIGDNESFDKRTKASLQLVVGQEQKLSTLDKLFYCINGGLDLYNEFGKQGKPDDFKKSSEAALGNKPISLPGGIGKITFKVVKHEEPSWWKRIFSFAESDNGRELISLIGLGGITQAAVKTIDNMVETLIGDQNEVLFKSRPVKLAFSEAGKTALGKGGGIVSCLNEGNWLLARLSDYELIEAQKARYNVGYGILQPGDMQDDREALDARSNPFSKITYAVLNAKLKPVDLTQMLP